MLFTILRYGYRKCDELAMPGARGLYPSQKQRLAHTKIYL
jgi:hypothetical protein